MMLMCENIETVVLPWPTFLRHLVLGGNDPSSESCGRRRCSSSRWGPNSISISSESCGRRRYSSYRSDGTSTSPSSEPCGCRLYNSHRSNMNSTSPSSESCGRRRCGSSHWGAKFNQ
ncbi:unnamed protein product, partial [Ectocarpus sp. 4 AP-2014]